MTVPIRRRASEIEHGRKRGSDRALAALVKALRVDVEDLLPPAL